LGHVVTVEIALTNISTVVEDAEASNVLEALSMQLRHDIAPTWNVDYTIAYYPKGNNPPESSWQLVICDSSDQAGALGYHDLTPQGRPQGKIFAGTDKKYGENWSVTASHELAEQILDPDVNLMVQKDSAQPLFVAYELADAVESQSCAYQIGDVWVSDFVTPAWFSPSMPGPYDFKEHLSAPFTLAPGGYCLLWSPGTGWSQSWGQETPHAASLAAPGSRRERRMRGRQNWLRSDAAAA
jgi:hypothetical protein